MVIREEIGNIVFDRSDLLHLYDDGYNLLPSGLTKLLSIKVGNRTLKELIELDEQGKLLEKAENQELPHIPEREWPHLLKIRYGQKTMLTPRDGEVWAKVKVK